MNDYAEQYEKAKALTAETVGQGLVREAVALAQQIRWNPEMRAQYKYPNGMSMATTCCLHICVDDPNFADHHVAFCIQHAAKAEHPDCLRLALMLARASMTQRKKINHLAWANHDPLEYFGFKAKKAPVFVNS